jgi:hypothetical protein
MENDPIAVIRKWIDACEDTQFLESPAMEDCLSAIMIDICDTQRELLSQLRAFIVATFSEANLAIDFDGDLEWQHAKDELLEDATNSDGIIQCLTARDSNLFYFCLSTPTPMLPCAYMDVTLLNLSCMLQGNFTITTLHMLEA